MRLFAIATLLALSLLIGGVAQAQSSDYELSGSITGGALLSGGDYSVSASVSRSDAMPLEGGDYTLRPAPPEAPAGGGSPENNFVYLPLIRY